MMSNEEFRKKYMGEFFFGYQMWYSISKEERNELSEEITPEFYKEWHDLWLQTPADKRIIEDELTYGQYKTYFALTKKYGLGYYRHTPLERAELSGLETDHFSEEKAFEDYDIMERRISGELYAEMDQRLLKMDQKFVELIKKNFRVILQS